MKAAVDLKPTLTIIKTEKVDLELFPSPVSVFSVEDAVLSELSFFGRESRRTNELEGARVTDDAWGVVKSVGDVMWSGDALSPYEQDMECADVPLLTPSSKEMMSQALKATFSGFTKEQQRLGIPK
ncbi:hypothetical protein STEG23_013281, partial [Scotinomys teguina]